MGSVDRPYRYLFAGLPATAQYDHYMYTNWWQTIVPKQLSNTKRGGSIGGRATSHGCCQHDQTNLFGTSAVKSGNQTAVPPADRAVGAHPLFSLSLQAWGRFGREYRSPNAFL